MEVNIRCMIYWYLLKLSPVWNLYGKKAYSAYCNILWYSELRLQNKNKRNVQHPAFYEILLLSDWVFYYLFYQQSYYQTLWIHFVSFLDCIQWNPEDCYHDLQIHSHACWLAIDTSVHINLWCMNKWMMYQIK